MDTFTSSALIGHLLASNVLAALVRREIISPEDAHELCEDSLLLLESNQKAFPEDDDAFAEARRYLEGLARFYGQRTDSNGQS